MYCLTKLHLGFLGLGLFLLLFCGSGFFGLSVIGTQIEACTGNVSHSSGAVREIERNLHSQALAVDGILARRRESDQRRNLVEFQKQITIALGIIDENAWLEKGQGVLLQERYRTLVLRQEDLLKEHAARIAGRPNHTEEEYRNTQEAYCVALDDILGLLGPLETGCNEAHGAASAALQSTHFAVSLSMGLLLALAIVVLIAINGFLLRPFVTKIKDLMMVLDAIVSGDLNCEFMVTTQDEFGRIGLALNQTITNLRKAQLEQDRQHQAALEQAEENRQRLERERAEELKHERTLREQERETQERLARQQRLDWEREKQEAKNREKAERLAQEVREAQVLRQHIDNLLLTVEAATQGDLVCARELEGDHPIAHLSRGIDVLIGELRTSMSAIRANSMRLTESSEKLAVMSGEMQSHADETAAEASVVSMASQEVSQSVQTVASSVEEMSASIREIAKSAAAAAQVAHTAVTGAQEATAMMSKLQDSSAKIGKVVKFITSVAEQTNLLALNATIEAAHAGEAGKGFAVVAHEVKELAKATAQATEDIRREIEGIQGDSRNADAALRRISDVIAQVNDISGTIAGAVEEQTATTNTMARNVAEAARSSNEITANITNLANVAQETRDRVEGTRAAAHELSRMASELRALTDHFRIEVEDEPKQGKPRKLPVAALRSKPRAISQASGV